MKNDAMFTNNRMTQNDKKIDDYRHTIDAIRKEADKLKENFQEAVTESQGLVGNAQTLQTTIKSECAALIE